MSKSQVTCECGAVYERDENKTIVRDSDSFDCQVCGREIEAWSSSRWPTFRLISKPERAEVAR